MNLWRRLEPVLASDLPTGDRMVLTVLACHADRQTRECRLKVATIARETGLTVRAVQKALSRLEGRWCQRSLIVRRGRKSSSLFRLLDGSANVVRQSTDGISELSSPIRKTDQRTTDIGLANSRGSISEPRSPRINRIEPDMNRSAGAQARETRAPRRARNGEWETESAADRRRRQLIDLAPILKVERKDGEGESAWLARVEAANERRLAEVNN